MTVAAKPAPLSAPPPKAVDARDEYALVTSTSREAPAADERSSAVAQEQAAFTEALRNEYGLLSMMLASVWSASLFRVSLLLGVVSAIAVGLGFAAQVGAGFGSRFTDFALVALPLALFLGVATFFRTVELQREALVYVAGMNRIRHAIADATPAIRPYLVLSTYDDMAGVYRSQGSGIRLRPPRSRLGFALHQTQGIVAVMCAAIAALFAGIATAGLYSPLGWAAAAVAFVAVLTALLTAWNRSIAELQKALRPMFPTPPEAVDAPI